MRPTYWGDVPLNQGIYYNNDQQIGQVLHALVARRNDPNVLSIRSNSQGVTDGAIMHLSTMLGEFLDLPTEVFWFIGYPESGFRDLGLELRKFLLKLWRKQDIRVMGESEYTALSYEVASGPSPADYLRLNLAALASRISNLNVLIVVDLQQTSHSGCMAIQALTRLFVNWAGKKGWAGAIVVFDSGSLSDSDVTFKAPDSALESILDSYRNRGTSSSLSDSPESVLIDAARLVHPLVLLGQPAQRTVLDYVLAHYPNAEEDLRALLLRSGAIWNLNGDAVRVSPKSLASFSPHTLRRQPSALSDTIPNGAKVLAFQGVDRLMPQLTGLHEIDELSIEATRLVDLFAVAIGQKKNSDPAFKETLRYLVKSIEQQEGKHRFYSPDHSRSLICYASQMLLTQARQFGAEFFPFLESLTFAHAEMLRLSSTESTPGVYEASRWVTNLGFVHKQINNDGRKRTASSAAAIYLRAVGYLADLNPADTREWASVRYDQAWHLWDAGDIPQSWRMFAAAANEVIQRIETGAITDEVTRVIAFELVVAALVIAPETSLDSSAARFLTGMLESYGSTLNIEDITRGLVSDKELIDGPGITRGLDADFLVISSYFDLHIALIVAAGLRRHFRRLPRVHLLGTSGHLSISELVGTMDAIIIGGPDTPGLSEFIQSYDAELARLYSLKILGNFAVHTNSSLQHPRLHVLSADGLLGNFDAWQIFLDRHGSNVTTPERNHMDQIIFDYLIHPLISAAEGRVFNEFVNAIGNRIKRKKHETVAALESFQGVNVDAAKGLLVGIDADVKTVLMEVTSPSVLAEILDKVMETLRAIELSPQQLLAISSLAYSLAVNVQRDMIAGSGEEIELSSYVDGFRDYRSIANHLLQTYRTKSVLDHEGINALAEKLARSLRSFKTASAKHCAQK
jgi:hypothetical protein